MKFLSELFSESSAISMMRVMSLICCLAAIVIAILTLYKADPDYEGASLLCGAFLSAAFTGKLVQKSIETKKTGP